MSNGTPRVPSGASATDIIGLVSNVGATAASAISQIQDAKQRQNFQNALMFLSQDKRGLLDRQLKEADSEVERIAILSQALSNLQSQRIGQLTTTIVQDERKKRNQTLLFAGGVVLVGGVIVYLILKNK
jgi:hypothetical protein